MLRNPVGGILYLVYLYLSSFFGSIFIMGPSLPLLLWQPSWFRYYNDQAIGLWLMLPPALLELVFDVRVLITGDKPPVNDASLIIMNHRCRLDWMFYWCVMHRYGELKHQKIMLKDDLKNIPGPGWAMQNSMYIFLRRRWEHDEGYLNTVLSYFQEVSYPLQLLIFPEGTNLDEESKLKSDSFARKNNRPLYEYVLHPRVRGFTYCVEKLRKGKLDAVHDVTVGYDLNWSFSEIDLLLGKFPHEMHFHMKRYPAETLPTEISELEEWCCERWAEKEDRLKKFYAIGQGFCPPQELAECRQDNIEATARNRLKHALLFWTVFIIICMVAVYQIIIVRWYFYIMIVFYVLQSLLRIGTDRLQLWSHRRFNKKK